MDPGVPSYRVSELAPRSHRFCVAVLVINEGERRLAQLNRMRPLADDVDILFADGGSHRFDPPERSDPLA